MTELQNAALMRFRRRQLDRFFSNEEDHMPDDYEDWEYQIDVASIRFETMLEEGNSLYETEKTVLEELTEGDFVPWKLVATLAALAGISEGPERK